MNYTESHTVAEAYDRIFPLSREEKEMRDQNSTSAFTQETPSNTEADQPTSTESASEPAMQSANQQDPAPDSTTTPTHTSEPSKPQSQESKLPPTSTSPSPSTLTEKPIPLHRNIYFYLHRPRTATKQPVLSPLDPSTTLTDTLRNRLVLEFPTIYVLREPLTEPSGDDSRFILENEYLQSHQDPAQDQVEEADAEQVTQPAFGAMDVPDVDEGKMLEVLRKDLLTATSGAEAS